MKQVQVLAKNEFVIKEVPKPQKIGAHSLLIQTNRVGICGSDLHIIHGLNPFASYPRIIGHEFGGIVVQVGRLVNEFSEGDRVCINPAVSCGECQLCQAGRYNICLNLKVLGVHLDGGLSEYVEVESKNALHFPKELDFSMVSAVEPYSIAANVLSRIGFIAGEPLLIFSGGVIGLFLLDYALALDAKVTVVDIVDHKLHFAQSIGAKNIINSEHEDVSTKVEKITGGAGFPFIVDAACAPSLLPTILESASFGGNIGLLGFLTETIPIAELNIVKKELTICGSRLNNQKFNNVLNLLQQRRLHPQKLISHKFPIDEFSQAIALVESQTEGIRKVVIELGSSS